MRRLLPIATGLMLGTNACSVGGSGATLTSAATVGEGGDDNGSSSSDGSTSDASLTSATSSGTPSDDTSTSMQSSDGSSGDTGIADPCAGELETFAIDPGWTAIGFPDPGNEYGWVGGGTRAGGDPGEIGGTFQRSGGSTVFADAVAPTAADTCIAARGRLVLVRVDGSFNSYIEFGHFAMTGGRGVGFAFAENGEGSVRLYMYAGEFEEIAFVLEDPGVTREWSYVYDPSTAMMSFMLEGYGSLSRPVTPQAAAGVVGLDEFGFRHLPHDNASKSPGQLETYLDEIEYTR